MGGDGGSAGAGGAAGTGGAGVSGGGTSSVGGAGGGGAGGAGGGQSGGSAGATGGSGGASVGGSGGSGGSAGAGGAGAGGSGGGSTGGSATGGAGAGGAAGGASGGTAGTSSGGFGANGGFGGACDPLDTTSCPGQRCGLVGSQFGCEPAGPDGDQAACTFDAMGFDSCQAGFTCILEPKTCYRVCDPTKMVADCAADEKCNYTINVTNGPSFHVCHPKPLQCDPLTQDCTDPSKACYPVPGGNECHTLGTKADGDACTFANDCMKGSVCENISAKQACYHMCNVMGGAPTCSTGTCMMVSGATYGLCL